MVVLKGVSFCIEPSECPSSRESRQIRDRSIR
jgi:hypothetical protein